MSMRSAFFVLILPAAIAQTIVPLHVPKSLRSDPFDIERTLTVPLGARISIYARVQEARFLAVTPEGELLVSQPFMGQITLLRTKPDGELEQVPLFEELLSLPHDMVFKTIGDKIYLYVGESERIVRYEWKAGELPLGEPEIVIEELPTISHPELGSDYGHPLKNIAIGPDGKLYVSVASATNAHALDALDEPVRGAIYQYDPDGKNGRLFARGVRNAEGLAFLPGTNILWITGNHRDNIAYPHHDDWDGDGIDDYGQIVQSYVNDHPPEYFTSIRDGGNYGWPFANPNPGTATGFHHMEYEPDVLTNPEWSVFTRDTFTVMDSGIQAHSAPLGFSFLQDSKVPESYRQGAVVALHGSWNRFGKTGYKIIYFPWKADGLPAAAQDFITGWLDEESQQEWGRPVDVIPSPDGGLYISDDQSGTIYKLTWPE
jgi:glucose/arabinose dehydrogenase